MNLGAFLSGLSHSYWLERKANQGSSLARGGGQEVRSPAAPFSR